MNPTSDSKHCIELRPKCALTRKTALLILWVSVCDVVRNRGIDDLRLAISGEQVRVDCFTVLSEEHLVFPRHWAKVTLRAPHSALHRSHLLIESRGRAGEIGGFLTEDERRGLAAHTC